jgi:hypothetical protein
MINLKDLAMVIGCMESIIFDICSMVEEFDVLAETELERNVDKILFIYKYKNYKIM